ncbi:hypothetical protein CDAR_578121 [Caerostris darwini]|uniref:Uncharacterized protein n=1 Tax=Caerostris darwini TaxID=1538125 RepID=A0AAV4QF56_9ARAC|nr:hypothetical protein CDAR_578121 [Caerostris darwini]
MTSDGELLFHNQEQQQRANCTLMSNGPLSGVKKAYYCCSPARISQMNDGKHYLSHEKTVAGEKSGFPGQQVEDLVPFYSVSCHSGWKICRLTELFNKSFWQRTRALERNFVYFFLH